MEALERAKARQAQRLNPKVLDPVVVTSMQDIKSVVAEFDPKKNPESHDIEIKTLLESEGETFEVRANTKSRSKRDMLVEGLELIKKRIEVTESVGNEGESVEINGHAMRPIPISSGVEGKSWVDPLIKQWTGGYREGIYICWNLDGFQYRYDIFAHKLTRVANAPGPTTTGSV